jgi:hypothetical protein
MLIEKERCSEGKRERCRKKREKDGLREETFFIFAETVAAAAVAVNFEI